MERASTSGLPMIKCSSCGIDIDILQLADHTCAPAKVSTPAAPAITPPESPKLDRAASLGTFSKRSEGQALPGRMRPPPSIDSNAANKPFRPLEPSPMFSATSSTSSYKMNRSATAPVPRPRLAPSSPKASSNLDCAFPPFPSKRNATPQSARPQQRDRLEPMPQQLYAEASPLFAPLSPRFDGGDNIKKRMDSIAPGPFDGRADRRPSTSGSSKPPSPLPEAATFGHQRTPTQGSNRSFGSMSRRRTSVSSTTSRSSAYSNRSVGLPAHPKFGANVNGTPPAPLHAASGSNEGIDAFLNRLQEESMRPLGLKGDPRRDGSRERKEPPPRPRRPSESKLPPSDMAELQPATFPSPPVNAFPPRNSSSGALNQGSTTVPPRPAHLALLQPNMLHDTPIYSLHTPSDSGLSDDSYASSSFRSVASSRSSPPGSEASHSRQTSKLGRSEYLGDSLERTASPDSYAGSPRRPSAAVSPRPSHSHSRINVPEPLPQSMSLPYAAVPESPMDPAIQLGIAFDRRPKQSTSWQDYDLRAPQKPFTQAPRVSPHRQDTRPSKGNCRGCLEPIVGKSVKDSSGRITGRFHKHCFVCKTCNDAFPTGEFYVFDNSPYCERHYHELNGSVCPSCNHGIEGQYLETDTRTKFHPRCFTCTTCRVVLRDGYYEFNGQRYCDRHAQSAAAPPQNFLGPGGFRPRMEKRSTRLMMMA
ncbi:hypothetical protein ACEQ8H_002073 [Pleosporales sp. CAS-2024a]